MYLASTPNDTTGLPISSPNIIVLYCIPHCVVKYIRIYTVIMLYCHTVLCIELSVVEGWFRVCIELGVVEGWFRV